MSSMVWRVAFPIQVSVSALMILLAWVTGLPSNPVLTAALLAGTPIVMIASGRLADFRVTPADVLFGLFLCAVVISIAVNGMPPLRDGALFAISLLAYPAGRLAPIGTPFGPFLIATAAIVGIGTVLVGLALVEQWNDPHGRPIVLGLAHTQTVFLTSLGFLLFAIICLDNVRRPVTAAIATAPALVIFAASQVRFTFLAIAGALSVGWLVTRRRQPALAVVGIVVACLMVGLALRPQTSSVFLHYIVSSANAAERLQSPPAGECGEYDNSVAIRKTLLRHAVQLVPSAGLFGHGISSSEQASCFKTYPHNTPLQALVELGWAGAALLVLLVGAALHRLWPIARKVPEAAFVLCCLSYAAMLDMAHGQLASEGLLFFFTGYAVRLGERHAQ